MNDQEYNSLLEKVKAEGLSEDDAAFHISWVAEANSLGMDLNATVDYLKDNKLNIFSKSPQQIKDEMKNPAPKDQTLEERMQSLLNEDRMASIPDSGMTSANLDEKVSDFFKGLNEQTE